MAAANTHDYRGGMPASSAAALPRGTTRSFAATRSLIHFMSLVCLTHTQLVSTGVHHKRLCRSDTAAVAGGDRPCRRSWRSAPLTLLLAWRHCRRCPSSRASPSTGRLCCVQQAAQESRQSGTTSGRVQAPAQHAPSTAQPKTKCCITPEAPHTHAHTHLRRRRRAPRRARRARWPSARWSPRCSCCWCPAPC